MIARLQGTIIEKMPPEIILDVSGVGYEIQLPMTSFYQLPEVEQSVTLFIHHVVREDAHLLFGFTEHHERSVFRVLIKANGIGPKLACTILSGMSSGAFVQAVLNEDISAIVKMPGVGKKTAERLVLELKDKVKDIDAPITLANTKPMETVSTSIIEPELNASEEAISALIALGYKKQQAEASVKKVADGSLNSEQIIRAALKSMI